MPDPFAQIPLNALHAIHMVAEAGTLREAANRLGVTQGAVSQHIRRTELRIGKKLFDRRPSGLAPSPVLQSILPNLAIGFGRLTAAVEDMKPTELTSLKITVGSVFATRFLLPRLSKFTNLEPTTPIEFEINGSLTDLSRAEIDFGIRFGNGDWPNVRSRKIAECSLVLVCTPEVATSLRTPADVLNVTVIRDSSTSSGWPSWLQAANLADASLRYSDVFSDPALAIDAALASQGILLAVNLLVGDLINKGKLVEPFAIRTTSLSQYWMVSAQGRAFTSSMHKIYRWLRNEAKAATPLALVG